MKYPDYDRSSLSISASIGEFFGGKSAYPTLSEIDFMLDEGVKNIVLVLCDGMGEYLLKRHLSAESFLVKKDRAAISSVFPSTTTAATTSIWTGVSPLEHGWLGWSLYFKECAQQIDAFTGNEGHTGIHFKEGTPAGKLMPLPPAMCCQTRAEAHMISAFGNYAGAGYIQHTVRDLGDMLSVTNSIISREGKKLVCVYYNQPDHNMHCHGVNSPEAIGEFVYINSELERFARTLKDDTLLIVTADHGLIDGKDPVIINEIGSIDECLWMPPSIEGRAAAFFVKPYRRAQFEREFNAVCGDRFLLINREDALKTNLFGRGIIHPKSEDFMGDYIACATGESYIRYDTIGGNIPNMIGMHAGLTDEEMTVPVILVRGERK